ncbi:hypothetical protein [Solemya velum gill symbiont]|nr:hypothetical protein [Solemya velum gill symbiont]
MRDLIRDGDEFWRWVTPGGGQPMQYAGVGMSRDGRVFRTWVTTTA